MENQEQNANPNPSFLNGGEALGVAEAHKPLSDEELKKVLDSPHRLIFICTEPLGGGVFAKGDLNKLGSVITQAMANNEQLYKFVYKCVNEAMTERSRRKLQEKKV